MKGLVLRSVCTFAVLGAAVVALSCARNHDLQSISVTPSQETLGIACGSPGVPTTCIPTTAYRAIGHYIHPQGDVDITSEVTWSTSNPDLITFADPSQPNVLYPTGIGCGTNLIVQATLNVAPGNTKIASATVNVNCGGSGGGSGGGNQLDFGITANPTSQTVGPSQQATYTIDVTAVTGTPTVGLSINNNNLPAGVAASLSPNSVTAGNTATLTLSSNTAGTYPVQILAIDGSGSTSISVTLIVS